MYFHMNVAQLKSVLRDRNASVRGKKSELIERLESYDRNSNFGLPNNEAEDEKFICAPTDLYKDVNSDTALPPLNKEKLQSFLDRFQKKTNACDLYEARHLITARAAMFSGYTYLKGQCKAQMKKVLYEVDIKINSQGFVEESHCECAAGSGTEAHCKHVVVLLYGIEDMTRTKSIIMHQVCTQVLMGFKKQKPFYASPIKSEHMPSSNSREINYNPLKSCEIMDNYEAYVRNLVINYGPTTMPIQQTYRPANPYAIENDHHMYCKYTPKQALLEKFHLVNVSDDLIKNIQESTRLQSNNPDWHKERSIRITASMFHSVYRSKDWTQSAKHLCEKILNPIPFLSRATSHGILQEPVALQKYEEMVDNAFEVKKCGLFVSKSHPFLAASSDGLIGDETLVEVKCPYASRNAEISPITVPYLVKNETGTLSLKNNHPYFTQIQGQLFCTNRKYCNLIVCTFNDLKIVYVARDEAFINDMVNSLVSFYNVYFQPALLNKYLYKNYNGLTRK